MAVIFETDKQLTGIYFEKTKISRQLIMAYWGQVQLEETFGRASDDVTSQPKMTRYESFF
jgi:hypothetical protein